MAARPADEPAAEHAQEIHHRVRLTEEQIQQIARIVAKTAIEQLSDAQMQQIGTIAAQKALDQVYAEVGKSVMKKALWLLGMGLLALMLYLAGKNALGPLVVPPHA